MTQSARALVLLPAISTLNEIPRRKCNLAIMPLDSLQYFVHVNFGLIMINTIIPSSHPDKLFSTVPGFFAAIPFTLRLNLITTNQLAGKSAAGPAQAIQTVKTAVLEAKGMVAARAFISVGVRENGSVVSDSDDQAESTLLRFHKARDRSRDGRTAGGDRKHRVGSRGLGRRHGRRGDQHCFGGEDSRVVVCGKLN